LAAGAAAAPINLVRSGQSRYSIVIAPDASLSERHGAEELQRFVEQMSGARLPITAEPQNRMVLVGKSPALDQLNLSIPFDNLGAEGFVLRTAGQHLVIAGGRLRGSLYGVYVFLEKLGCRWFTPDVSRIPKMRSITAPNLDETGRPAFEYREPFFAEAYDADWAARNRMNGQSQRLDAARGGKVQYFPFVHSFNRLIPPAEFFKEHPEYFSLVDGQRRAERSQLCLTNPDVLRIGVETVERWIAEHPEAGIISISHNDWHGWCECDNCRRVEAEEGGAHQGPLLRYVNALAAEIEKKHPDKLIDTLAYQYTEEPPAKVRPRRNVRIRLCPIGVCEAHPYEQCKYSAYFMKNLRAWSKVTNQLYIWHYNTNFAHYLVPYPDFDELAADIPMYKRYGVVGMFMEGSPSRDGGAENAELRSYVMAKLLWDVNANVNQAIDEFHEAYYGKAAKPMRAYFDLTHRQVRMPPNGKGHHFWITDPPSSPYLSDDFLAEAATLFQQAEAAADSDAVRRRVRKARLSIEYVALRRTKKFTVEGGWYRPADMNVLKENWNNLVKTARSFGMTQISENSQLSQEDEYFQALMRPYRVSSLENDRLLVHVVPELGGRVTHIIEKRSGRNLLQEPEPAGTRVKHYPNMGGLTVAVYPDYVSTQAHPFNAQWKLEPGASANALTLSTSSEAGLTMRRRLRLDGAFLRTETILENGANAPVQALVQSRWDVDPGDLERVAVTYRKQSGEGVQKALIEPEKEPRGTEAWGGADRPAGEWRVVSRSGGPVWVNRFPNDEVARCYLNWTLKGENRVGMYVSSNRRTLQPGERLSLAADYGVE
jgi:hypothetical protein